MSLSNNIRETLRKAHQEKDLKAKERDTNKVDLKEIVFKPELIGNQTEYTVRFLPNKFKDEGQGEPWSEQKTHSFVNEAQVKVFTVCPKNLGADTPCPVCEVAKELFVKVNGKTASKAEEQKAFDYYVKPRYRINVLVVSDPRKGPKNRTGEVLVLEMGKQLYKIILDAFKTMNFDDPNTGNNFKLVLTKQGNDYHNYLRSFFEPNPTPIASTPEKVTKILDSVYDINKLFNFKPKSYDEIKGLIKGEVPPKTERTFDSNTGTTTTEPLGNDAGNTVDFSESETSSLKSTPPARGKVTAAAAAAAAEPVASVSEDLSDDELLRALSETDD